MVVHIGVDSFNGIGAAYSTVTGDLETLNIEKISPHDAEKIDSQFQIIKERFPESYLNIVEDDTDIKKLSVTSNRVTFSLDLNGIFTLKELDIIEVLDKKLNEIEINNDGTTEECSPPSETIEDQQNVFEENIESAVLHPSNIKPVIPKYIIPEKFEHYIEIIQQLGTIQTELNILNPLVAITNTEFNLANFDYLQKCHESYKPAIFIKIFTETLLENVKGQVNSEIDRFGGNYLKDITDSVVTKHETLKQNYDKNEKLFQKAETYLASFNHELDWINSKLIDDEIKFDNFECSLNALKMFEKLKQEVEDRGESYQTIINNGKNFFTEGEIDNLLNNLDDKWKQLQDHLKFYSTIVTEIQKVLECMKKSHAIEEWISIKSMMIDRNDSNTGSEINKEILMKKTKKSLDEVKAYCDTIESFEKDTNAIKKEIILSGNAIKTKLSAIMDQLEIRISKIKIFYDDLKEKVNDQIKNLEDEKVAFEFNKKCIEIEKWIKTTIESIDIEVTKDKIDAVKKAIIDAEENSKTTFEKDEILTLTKNGEELHNLGFPEAKLKIANIEILLAKRDKILEAKKIEIKEFTQLDIFLSNCDIVIQRIQNEMEVIKKLPDKSQLEEHKKDQKRFNDNIGQLQKTGENLKSKNYKYANVMDEKILELQQLNKKFSNLIEQKTSQKLSQKSESDKLTEVYDTARNILEFLEQIESKIEWSDAVETTSNNLMEEHLKLKECISAKEKEIGKLNLLVKNITMKMPTLTSFNPLLEKIAKAKQKLDLIWEERYKEYQRIEHVAAFDSIADETMKVLKEYYGFLKNNKAKKMDKVQMSNMLGEVNLHIDNLQKTSHTVIKIHGDLAEFVNKKVCKIMDMQQELINEQNDESDYDSPDEDETPEIFPSVHPNDPEPLINTEKHLYQFPQKVSNYDNQINAVGIDLGTSRCCMAVSRNNKMETVALENAGERPLPSFVSFDEEDVKCGDVVLKGFLKYKEKYTVFDVKRFIGKEFHDIVPDRSWPFQVIEENDKVMIKIEDVNGEVLKTPEEISAILLKYMKEKAKEFQGKPETKAVLTVPAAFTDSQKKATLESAKLAGWENITLLPEPIAASFAYFNNREIPNNSNVLLFDLGGGTLDVCLFKIINGSLQIISNIGDTCLGGRDIDNLLIRHFTNALKFKYSINVNERVRRKYLLMLECQAIKHNLTIMKKD
uniref:Uncharacterized protein n=1 Tax=Panagrolaimus sp. ES5 TaxID=591445 RepID=A0AC34FIT5_9BILA